MGPYGRDSYLIGLEWSQALDVLTALQVVQRACALQSDRPGFASFVVQGKLIFSKPISSSEK